MYLSYQEKLPQGTPLFEVEAGYKSCSCPGTYLARRHAEKTVCPGCDRICQMQVIDIKPGEQFVVRKRPSKKQRSR